MFTIRKWVVYGIVLTTLTKYFTGFDRSPGKLLPLYSPHMLFPHLEGTAQRRRETEVTICAVKTGFHKPHRS